MKHDATLITVAAGALGAFLCVYASLFAWSAWSFAGAEVQYGEAAKGRAKSIAELDALTQALRGSPWQGDLSRAAFVEMRAAQQLGLKSPRARARLAAARRDVQRGLLAAPSDAYAWTRLAVIDLELDGPAPPAAAALSVALQIAPAERKLTAIHIDLSAALWAHLDAVARAAVSRRLSLAEKWPEFKSALAGNSARALRHRAGMK